MTSNLLQGARVELNFMKCFIMQADGKGGIPDQALRAALTDRVSAGLQSLPVRRIQCSSAECDGACVGLLLLACPPEAFLAPPQSAQRLTLQIKIARATLQQQLLHV